MRDLLESLDRIAEMDDEDYVDYHSFYLKGAKPEVVEDWFVENFWAEEEYDVEVEKGMVQVTLYSVTQEQINAVEKELKARFG